MMKVWVVMGNDYPAGVFSSERKADAFCEAKKSEDRKEGSPHRGRISWRSYEFGMNKT